MCPLCLLCAHCTLHTTKNSFFCSMLCSMQPLLVSWLLHDKTNDCESRVAGPQYFRQGKGERHIWLAVGSPVKTPHSWDRDRNHSSTSPQNEHLWFLVVFWPSARQPKSEYTREQHAGIHPLQLSTASKLIGARLSISRIGNISKATPKACHLLSGQSHLHKQNYALLWPPCSCVSHVVIPVTCRTSACALGSIYVGWLTLKRPACLMKQFSLLEIISTCSAASCCCRSF